MIRRPRSVLNLGSAWPDAGSTRHSSTLRGWRTARGISPSRRRCSSHRMSTRTAPRRTASATSSTGTRSRRDRAVSRMSWIVVRRPPIRSGSGRRVPVAADLAERAALNPLLERVAETHGAPVLAAELVADRAAVVLALFLEQVLDQRDLAVQPPLVLFLVDARGRRERGVARRAHRSPPG